MDIALDTNILVADPWLRAQRTRVLVSYLERTRSRLILLDAVETELRAFARRHFGDSARQVEAALSAAARHGLKTLPSFDAASSVAETFDAWEANFNATLPSRLLERVIIEPTILSEAVRRAAERVPPCSPSGKELRDTITWLGLLAHLRTRKAKAQVVFISANTSDFASADKRTLLPQLEADVAGVGCEVQYFAGLDDFAKAHAERIAHITLDWVKQRVAPESIADLVSHHLEHVSPESYVTVASSEYSDSYEPRTTSQVFSVAVTLTDVYVWKTGDTHIELGIEFEAYCELDADCVLVGDPRRRSWQDYDDWLDEHPMSRTLTCYGELAGLISAAVVGDEVELLELEDLSRR